jgi:hypothetical protein
MQNGHSAGSATASKGKGSPRKFAGFLRFDKISEVALQSSGT